MEAVRKYKKSSVEQRNEMQGVIYSNFLKIGAKHQLNISENLSKQVDVRVMKGLGEIDLFHDVEEFVKSMVVVDSYQRYLKQKEVTD